MRRLPLYPLIDRCNLFFERIIKFIGKGGFGSVYTAIHDGKLVAVKKGEFDADAEEDTSDILNEIEFLSDLRHPNIVKYIACGRDDTNIYIFMEYMEGIASNATVGCIFPMVISSKFCMEQHRDDQEDAPHVT